MYTIKSTKRITLLKVLNTHKKTDHAIMMSRHSEDRAATARGSLRSQSSPSDFHRGESGASGLSGTSSTLSSASAWVNRGNRGPPGRTLLGAATRDYARAHGRAGRGHGDQAYSVYNDLRDSWSSSARSSAAARFSSERRTGSSAPLQRSHSEDLAFSEHPRSSLGRGNDTSAGSRETLTALEAAARHRALQRHESSRTQRAWCQLSRMVGMDVTLQ